eukprot:gene28417-35218_t
MSDSDSEDEDVREEEYEKLKTGEIVLRTERTAGGVVVYSCAYCSFQPKPIEQLLLHARNSKKKMRYEHEGLAKYLDEFVIPNTPKALSGGAPPSPPNVSELLDKQTTEGIETVWPPVLILANMPLSDSDGDALGNPELRAIVNQCARNFDFNVIRKVARYYDSGQTPTDKVFVVFETSYAGYIEADDLSKILEQNDRGKVYGMANGCENGEKCGWIATVAEMERLDPKQARLKWSPVPLSEVRDMHKAEKRKREQLQGERDYWKREAVESEKQARAAQSESHQLRLRNEAMAANIEERRQATQRIVEETEKRLVDETERRLRLELEEARVPSKEEILT